MPNSEDKKTEISEQERAAEARQLRWNELIETLNAAGCDIDPASNADLARLMVFDVRKTADGETVVEPTCATDPTRFVIRDGITDEDVLSHASTEVPDGEVYSRILTAAREGRLFVAPSTNSEYRQNPRPIRLNENGKLYVANDWDRMPKEEVDATEVMEAPVMPAEPTTGTRIGASFGSREASARMAAYDRRMERYRADEQKWQRISQMDPAFVTRARNTYEIYQSYFYNPLKGEEIMRRGEQLARLQRADRYAKMTPRQKEAADEVSRQREAILALVRNDVHNAVEAGQVKSGEALTEEGRLILAKLIVARREMIRAQRSVNAGTFFEPKEPDFAQAQAQLLVADETFLQVASKMEGSALTRLEEQLLKGESAVTDCLDAYWMTAVDHANLNEEGENIVHPGDIDTVYTAYAYEYMDKKVQTIVQRAFPDEKVDSLEGKHVDYIYDHYREMIDEAGSDPFTYSFRNDQSTIEKLCRKINPNYTPLSPAERMHREENARLLMEKYCRYSMEKSLSLDAIGNDPPVDRVKQAMYDYRFNDESLDYNFKLRNTFLNGTVDEQRKAFFDKFEELEELDISSIDLLDDDKFIEQFEDKIAPLLLIGPDIPNIVKVLAPGLGIDLRADEYKPLLSKLASISDIVYVARCKIDMLTHPVYTQLRTEDIEANIDAEGNAVDADGNRFEMDDFLDEAREGSNRSTERVIRHIGDIKKIAANNPLMDRTLAPKERVRKHDEVYWDKTWDKRREIYGVDPPMGYMNGKVFPKTYRAENDEIYDKDYFRFMFHRHIELIREVYPDFTMTEEEIDSYITDERIEFVRQAREHEKATRDIEDMLKGITFPANLKRIVTTFFDKSNTEDAKRYNSELLKNLTDPTKSGDEFRRKLLADSLNEMIDFDASDFTADADIERIGPYILENADTLLRGWDMPNSFTGLEASMGARLTENGREAARYVNDATVKGSYGATWYHLMSTGLLVTFPYDKFNYEQTGALCLHFAERGFDKMPASQEGYSGTFMTFFNTVKDSTMPEGEFKKLEYDDIRSVRPDLIDTRDRLAELSRSLKSDAAEGGANSAEYGALASSLKNAAELLYEASDGLIDPKLAAAVRESLQTLSRTAKAYTNYAEKLPQESRPTDTANTANEVSDALRYVTGEPLFTYFIESYNDDYAKGYYNEVREFGRDEEIDMDEAFADLDENREAIEKSSILGNEKMFLEGLTRTDKLREELERLDQSDPEGKIRFEIGSRMLESREKLTNLVGRTEYFEGDHAIIKKCIAEVMVGTLFKSTCAGKENGTALYEECVRQTLADPQFELLTAEITSDDINYFLEGPGEHEMANDYMKVRTVRPEKTDEAKLRKENVIRREEPDEQLDEINTNLIP